MTFLNFQNYLNYLTLFAIQILINMETLDMIRNIYFHKYINSLNYIHIQIVNIYDYKMIQSQKEDISNSTQACHLTKIWNKSEDRKLF